MPVSGFQLMNGTFWISMFHQAFDVAIILIVETEKNNFFVESVEPWSHLKY